MFDLVELALVDPYADEAVSVEQIAVLHEGQTQRAFVYRLALNARVRATAGDLVQVGEVLSGGSYLSQHDLRIHLGLGSDLSRRCIPWTPFASG